MFNACDEGYRINTKKLIREEQELMEDFVLDQDSLKDIQDSILDVLEQDGLVYFETSPGTGDSVMPSQKIAFRYTFYEVVRDSLGNPFLWPQGSNMSSESPYTYVTGNTNYYNNGVYPGWDMVLQKMALGTKARAYIFSSLWDNQYTPRVIDFEVTYVEK